MIFWKIFIKIPLTIKLRTFLNSKMTNLEKKKKEKNLKHALF
jgi:hypothetical protein